MSSVVPPFMQTSSFLPYVCTFDEDSWFDHAKPQLIGFVHSHRSIYTSGSPKRQSYEFCEVTSDDNDDDDDHDKQCGDKKDKELASRSKAACSSQETLVPRGVRACCISCGSPWKDDCGEKQILYSCNLHGLDHVVRVCVGVMTWGGVCCVHVCMYACGIDIKIELLQTGTDAGCLCVKTEPWLSINQTHRHDSTDSRIPHHLHLLSSAAAQRRLRRRRLDSHSRSRHQQYASMIRLLNRAVPW